MFAPLVFHPSTHHTVAVLGKSNSLCLTFIVTESGFHRIPSLVYETETETECTDSGNCRTAPGITAPE